MRNDEENHIFNLTGIQKSDIVNVMKSEVFKGNFISNNTESRMKFAEDKSDQKPKNLWNHLYNMINISDSKYNISNLVILYLKNFSLSLLMKMKKHCEIYKLDMKETVICFCKSYRKKHKFKALRLNFFTQIFKRHKEKILEENPLLKIKERDRESDSNHHCVNPNKQESSKSTGFFCMLSDLCIQEKKQEKDLKMSQIDKKIKSGNPFNILNEEEFKTKFTNLFVVKQDTTEGDKLLKEAKVLKEIVYGLKGPKDINTLKNEILDFHVKTNKKEILDGKKTIGTKLIFKTIATSADIKNEKLNFKNTMIFRSKTNRSNNVSLQHTKTNANLALKTSVNENLPSQKLNYLTCSNNNDTIENPILNSINENIKNRTDPKSNDQGNKMKIALNRQDPILKNPMLDTIQIQTPKNCYKKNNFYNTKNTNVSNYKFKDKKDDENLITPFKSFIRNSEKQQIKLEPYNSKPYSKNFEFNSEENNFTTPKAIRTINTSKSKDTGIDKILKTEFPYQTTLGINANDISDLTDEDEFYNVNRVLNTLNTNLELIKRGKLYKKNKNLFSINPCNNLIENPVFANYINNNNFITFPSENIKPSLSRPSLKMYLNKGIIYNKNKELKIPLIQNKIAVKRIRIHIPKDNLKKDEILKLNENKNYANEDEIKSNRQNTINITERCPTAKLNSGVNIRNFYSKHQVNRKGKENLMKTAITTNNLNAISDKIKNKNPIGYIPFTSKAQRFYLLMRNKNIKNPYIKDKENAKDKSISYNKDNQNDKLKSITNQNLEIDDYFEINDNCTSNNKNNKEDSNYLLSKNDFYYNHI